MRNAYECGALSDRGFVSWSSIVVTLRKLPFGNMNTSAVAVWLATEEALRFLAHHLNEQIAVFIDVRVGRHNTRANVQVSHRKTEMRYDVFKRATWVTMQEDASALAYVDREARSAVIVGWTVSREPFSRWRTLPPASSRAWMTRSIGERSY